MSQCSRPRPAGRWSCCPDGLREGSDLSCWLIWRIRGGKFPTPTKIQIRPRSRLRTNKGRRARRDANRAISLVSLSAQIAIRYGAPAKLIYERHWCPLQTAPRSRLFDGRAYLRDEVAGPLSQYRSARSKRRPHFAHQTGTGFDAPHALFLGHII
jgi:hypothetical protein